MNLLNAGVMNGLMGAATMMKATDTSMGMYQQAKGSGDLNVMGNALGYAAASMGSAAQYAEQVEEALKQAQLEASEQAKADQEAALEEKRAEVAAQKAIVVEQQVLSQPSPVDGVEIDTEVQTATADNTQPIVSERPVLPTAGSAQPVVKVYTPQGQFKLVSGETGTTVSVKI